MIDLLHHPHAMLLAARSLQIPSTGGAFLLLAAAALYAASRAAAAALAGENAALPGRRAVGHVLPAAAVALCAAALGDFDLAVTVVFSTCVATLALAMGALIHLSPPVELPPVRRVGLFILPAALATLLAGFSGSLSWLHAVLLLAIGFAVLGVWREQSASLETALAAAANEPIAPTRSQPALLGLALVLCLIGGWSAARGAQITSESSRLLTNGLIAAAVVGPLLALPMIGSAADLAQHGHIGSGLCTFIGATLLLLCGVLPLVALSGYVAPGVRAYLSPPEPIAIPDAPTSQPTTQATTQPSSRPATQPVFRKPRRTVVAPSTLWGNLRQFGGPVRFPLGAWRVDSVLLVVIGLSLVPFTAGRWLPGRAEATALLLLYAAYLIASAYLAARSL